MKENDKIMQKITPFLWFNTNAEEAINFYAAVFKDFKTGSVSRYGEGGPGPKGTVMTATFQLFGQDFIALNGGPQFTFNESISFVINCENQDEIDYYWEKLSEGGTKSRCGWLKDQFGLSWQIVPIELPEVFQGDPAKSQNAMKAMMKMDKLDINILKQAYAEG